MIWIFDRADRLKMICSNQHKEALPIVSAEMHEVLNGDINLDFEVPLDHEKASDIQSEYTAAVQRSNGQYELFIITEMQEIKGAGESVLLVSCRHAIQELQDEIIDYYFADRKPASLVLPDLLEGTRWTVGTAQDTDPHDITVENESVLDAVTTFIKRWEGEINFNFEITSEGIQRREINFFKQIGQDAGRRFEWSRDLDSIKRTVDSSSVKTALVGIGKVEQAEGETGEAADLFFDDISWTAETDPTAKPAGQHFVEDPEAREQWGRIRADGSKGNRLGFYRNSDIHSKEDLLQATWEALQELKKPQVSYQVTVLDLAKIEGRQYHEVNLGDIARIIDRKLNLSVSARVLEIKHDLLRPTDTTLQLDSFQEILTEGESVEDPSIRLDEIEAALGDKVTRGEVIPTEWLEEEINLLTHRIKAGGGTVTMNEGEGILVEEDPEGKTGGAIKLIGGVLAIADTYNAATGSYNWRSFGTGEGWLGDIMKTGKLTFNNASGGTLTLGGEDNQNGIMIVRNSRGENIAELSGDYGGFGSLRIDELRDTQNVIFTTYNNTENLDGDIYYYIDAYEGSDSNIGTKEAPLASVQEAIDRLPKYLAHNVFIYYGSGLLNDSHIYIAGFAGSGTIYLRLWPRVIRYVRDWANGSSTNTGTHWVEVQGQRTDDSIRHGDGDTTSLFTNGRDSANLIYISDNNTQTGYYYDAGTRREGDPYWVDVYLRAGLTDYKSINIWHYHADGRTYYDTKTEVSEDRETWYTIFDSEREGTYSESSDGHRIYVHKAYLKGRVELRQNSTRIDIQDLFIDAGDDSEIPVRAYFNQYIAIRNCVAFGGSGTSYLFYCMGTNGIFTWNEANQATEAAVYNEQGNIYIYSMKGSKVANAFRAHGAGLIAGEYHAPYADNLIEWTTNGGTISGSWYKETGEFSPITVTEKQKTWTNTDAGSWAEHYGVWDSTSNGNDVLQGKWDVYGLYRGLWFYSADMRNTVSASNVEITKIRVYVTRANSSGYSSGVPIYLMPHGYTSKPSYAPSLFTSNVVTKTLARGESAWVDCTSKFKDLFASGEAYGVGIYTSDTSNAKYARMTPNSKIEITYKITV